MNKQEAIEEIKKQSTQAYDDFAIMRDTAIHIVNQIDEPQKVTVPKNVAEWIDTLDEHGLFGLNYDVVDESVWNWVYENYDCNVKKLHLAYLYGYETEQEKMYTVEIPNPNSAGGKLVLFKQQSTGRLILDMLNPNINKPKYLHITESEIKQDFEWAWDAGFAKEVE